MRGSPKVSDVRSCPRPIYGPIDQIAKVQKEIIIVPTALANGGQERKSCYANRKAPTQQECRATAKSNRQLVNTGNWIMQRPRLGGSGVLGVISPQGILLIRPFFLTCVIRLVILGVYQGSVPGTRFWIEHQNIVTESADGHWSCSNRLEQLAAGDWRSSPRAPEAGERAVPDWSDDRA